MKKLQTPEEPREPTPSITPEMVQTAFRALESKGMILYSEGGVYIPTETGWKLLMNVSAEKEEVNARGSSDVIATSKNSITILKSKEIRTDKDSVIAVKADKTVKEFNPEFKRALQDRKKVQIRIDADNVSDRIVGYGSPALKLTSENAIVIRKDDFIDSRTIAIMADKAAFELKKELVDKLKNHNTKVKITLEIKT